MLSETKFSVPTRDIVIFKLTAFAVIWKPFSLKEEPEVSKERPPGKWIGVLFNDGTTCIMHQQKEANLIQYRGQKTVNIRDGATWFEGTVIISSGNYRYLFRNSENRKFGNSENRKFSKIFLNFSDFSGRKRLQNVYSDKHYLN